MSSKGGKKDYKRKMKGVSTTPKIINPDRVTGKGQTHLRSKDTINRLAMYKETVIRDRNGTFLSGKYMSKTPDAAVMRIAPDRRWFGNTRVVGQKELATFREEMSNKASDPYTFVMRSKKLPMSLLSDPVKSARMDLLSAESFKQTFGKTSTRKKPRLGSAVGDVEALLGKIQKDTDKFESETDYRTVGTVSDPNLEYQEAKEQKIFDKGQSKRIWGELYKVIDASDVVIQVLDARDPMGTRSKRIENELKKPDRRHKHLILVLNKCDLVPTWVTRRWVKVLSAEYPTLAFHASVTNPFGKGALIQLLRQFSILHKDKKQISVGFVGYPNVGKSSTINALRGKDVCKAAPIPGETKVWKYITLYKRIFLIDCPGTVYSGVHQSSADKILKGVVRIENVEEPADYVPDVLDKIKKEYLIKTYGLTEWTDATDFLTQFAKKAGKLRAGGEPDFNNCAKIILNDWQRGRLPFFVPPPFEDDLERQAELEAKKRAGQLRVEQLFDSIHVKVNFSAEDSQVPAQLAQWQEKEREKEERAAKDALVDEDAESDEDVEDDEAAALAAAAESALKKQKGKKTETKEEKKMEEDQEVEEEDQEEEEAEEEEDEEMAGEEQEAEEEEEEEKEEEDDDEAFDSDEDEEQPAMSKKGGAKGKGKGSVKGNGASAPAVAGPKKKRTRRGGKAARKYKEALASSKPETIPKLGPASSTVAGKKRKRVRKAKDVADDDE